MTVTDPPPSVRESPHLSTERLRKSVGKHAMRGAAILGIARPIRVVLALAITAVLARLLTPLEFGLVGMVAIVMRLIDNFQDMGLGSAMIQRDDITDAQLNSLFWINCAGTLLLATILASLSPVIAWFFGDPRLVKITCGLAVGIAITGIGLQHKSLLRRQMRFGALMIVELTGFALAGATAIALAIGGASYWALVARTVAEATACAVGFALASRWKPSAPSIAPGVGSLVRFGTELTGFKLLNFFSRNADDLLIAKLFGPTALASYQKAYDLMLMGARQVVTPAGQVAMPALSRLLVEPEKYRTAYFRMIDKVLLLTAPGAAMLIAVPDWIVSLLLGKQWTDVAPIAGALGVAVLLQPISGSIGWLLTSQNRTAELPRLALISGGLNLVLFSVGAFWGPLGVATAYAAGQFVRTPIGLGFTTRTGPVPARDMYVTLATFTVAGAVGAGATYVARGFLTEAPSLIALACASLVCVISTMLTLAAIPRGRRALLDVRRTTREYRTKRRR